jgi:S1-C subfamily serine protease
VASALLLASGVGIGWILRTGDRNSQTPVIIQQGGGQQSGGQQGGVAPGAVQSIAGKVTPGLVDINTFTDADLGSSVQVPLGAGTGMILTSSGEVLTNNHVVEGANSIRATIPSTGATYRADVVGVDPSADVALIQLEGASGLSTVSTGNSSSLSSGQQVVAIGNALGRGGAPSVTSGSVSSLNQSITVSDDRGGSEHLSGLIQSDASISPGDSGGAIVTTDGKVVGMITASATQSPGQSSSRIGYAIPINAALAVVGQVRSGQATADVIIGPAGYLGIEARNIDAATAARLGVSTNAGALVVGVEPGTSAAHAGLSRLSVITAVDGTHVTSADTLGPTIHVHKPGEQVRVTWIDQTGTHTATIRLVSGPAV